MDKLLASSKRVPASRRRQQRPPLGSATAFLEPCSPQTSADPERAAQWAARHLRTPEAARYLGVSVSFLNHARLHGNGPVYRKLSAKVVVYSLHDLQAWADSKTKRSTSGAPP